MLIVFVATQGDNAPDLRHLNIRDSATGSDIPVAGLDGWDDDYLQVQLLCNAPLDLQGEQTGMSAGDTTDQYWTRRLSKLIVKMKFTVNHANAVIRPLYYDKDGAEIPGDSVTVNAISRQENSLYMAPMEVFDILGANKMAVTVESVSSGTVTIALAGV